MIKLNSGAGCADVLAVKLKRDWQGRAIHGTVLAFTGTEYVTWRVSSFDGGATYDAYSGNYLRPSDTSEDAYLVHLEDLYNR
jgi:hypothetical protein